MPLLLMCFPLQYSSFLWVCLLLFSVLYEKIRCCCWICLKDICKNPCVEAVAGTGMVYSNPYTLSFPWNAPQNIEDLVC